MLYYSNEARQSHILNNYIDKCNKEYEIDEEKLANLNVCKLKED